MKFRTYVLLLCLVAILTVPGGVTQPDPAGALAPAEAACAAMGAKCVCSRTFRAPSFSVAGGGEAGFWRESDYTAGEAGSKFCGWDQNGGGTFYATQAVGTATEINGYNVLRLGPGGGVMTGGWSNSQNPSAGRIGTRIYFRNSSDYVTRRTALQPIELNGCYQDKMWQVGDYFEGTSVPGSMIQWHGDAGCTTPCVPIESLNGKLIRLEVYMQSTGGTYPNMTMNRVDVFWKNVTDNTPEASRLNISGSNLDLMNQFLAGFKEPAHYYRADGGAAGQARCNGTKNVMYLLVAHNLAPGERIPPASEVETVTPPPAAPSNLRFRN